MRYATNAFFALLDALGYRLRGGGFFSTGSNWYGRAIFASCLMATYGFSGAASVDVYYAVCIIPLGIVAMLVPHAFAQNMGRWPTPQKGWPAFFLPTLTDLQWASLPDASRTLYDFCGMAGVAAFRAIIVFGPSVASSYLQHGQIEPWGFLRAFGILTMGQPFAYLTGWLVPFSIGKSLTKYSTEWAEFLNGAVWAAAVGAL